MHAAYVYYNLIKPTANQLDGLESNPLNLNVDYVLYYFIVDTQVRHD